MLLHTIEGVTDVIYFFSGCKRGERSCWITCCSLESLQHFRIHSSILLFLIGLVSVTPTLLGKKQTHSRAPADTAASSNWSLARHPAPSFPVHTEAQCLVVAPWLRIKWHLSLATNMARVPTCLHLWKNFCADIVKGMYHIMDSWSPHAGLLSILVFNWFTDYCILHTLTRFNQ